MSLVRPEVAALLRQWREALIGVGVAAIGVYWSFFTGGGLLHWVGYVVLAIGLLLAVSGLQRARFRLGQGGQGIVSILERRISYFGPLSGGIVDLGALEQVALDRTSQPPHWQLAQPGQPDIAIPLNAEGAEALFDAFSTLPGIRTENMLRQMHSTAHGHVVIWQSDARRDRLRRLH